MNSILLSWSTASELDPNYNHYDEWYSFTSSEAVSILKTSSIMNIDWDKVDLKHIIKSTFPVFSLKGSQYTTTSNVDGYVMGRDWSVGCSVIYFLMPTQRRKKIEHLSLEQGFLAYGRQKVMFHSKLLPKISTIAIKSSFTLL